VGLRRPLGVGLRLEGQDALVHLVVPPVGPDGLLYVGGDFTSVLGIPADRIARWNGTSWSAVRGGLNGSVNALQSFRNEVHAGGTFGKSENQQNAAPAWARYTVDGIPWIARQPVATHSCSDDEADIYLTIAPGYFPLTAQWRHNGIPISMGLRPWGSDVAYSSPYGLRIENARGADSGLYDCTITHEGCGSVTTIQALLTICVADLDDGSGTGRCDGGVTIDDLLYFLDAYDAGTNIADVDNGLAGGVPDGGVGIEDLLYFLSRFEAGC
jgi:hypothetical protein